MSRSLLNSDGPSRFPLANMKRGLMPKKEFCPYCGGHVGSGNCACGDDSPIYKVDPLFQFKSPLKEIFSNLIAKNSQDLNEHVESLIRIRTSMSLPRNIITGRGVDPASVAVISTVMANSILALHCHWYCHGPDPDRRTTSDILYDYIGRRTFIIEEAPDYEIKYYHSHHQVREAYPDWWANTQFMVGNEDEEID